MSLSAGAPAVPRRSNWTPIGVALVVLVLAGLALRVVLAAAHGAYGGDPLFSYQYRATLIAAGHLEGVLLMWHPPGYPMLLAALMAVSGHAVSSYAAGVAISLASTAALVWLVDRLVAPYLIRPEFRLVAAAIILFNEGLVHWQSAVLSEPPYLAAVAGMLVLLHEGTMSARRAVLAGALAGAATLLRFDGAAMAAGLALLVWYRFGLARALGFGLGFIAVAGWVLGNVAYLEHVYAAQRLSVTVTAPLPWRLPAGVYHAITAWLPMAMPLPFWCAAAIGAFVLLDRTRNRAGVPLNALLATALLIGVTFGAVSVMHKRTAAFVVPLLAIWCAIAADALAGRVGPRVVLAAVLAVVGLDSVRLAAAWPPSGLPTATDGQSHLLREANADQAPVFAFGSEPEIYASLEWPIVTPFFEWRSTVTPVYEEHRGDPEGFVRALAVAGYGWLAVASPQAGMPVARQPYGDYIAQPLAADLAALAADPRRFGLTEAGHAATQPPYSEVRIYRIAPGPR